MATATQPGGRILKLRMGKARTLAEDLEILLDQVEDIDDLFIVYITKDRDVHMAWNYDESGIYSIGLLDLLQDTLRRSLRSYDD